MESESSNKMQSSSASTPESQVALHDINKIKTELELLNSHKLITAYNSIPRLLVFQFLKGTAFGLGTLVGATIVMSIIVFVLSQVEFVPIIGEWVTEILQEIKQLAPSDQ